MKIFLFLLIFLTKYSIKLVAQDLTGLYDFENCACTALRCLDPQFYRIDQTYDGDLIIHYRFNTVAAQGKVQSIDYGRQTQVSIKWLPLMDFDTNCTGLWIPKTRTIDLRCGNRNQYCIGQLICRYGSGPCAGSNSILHNTFSKLIISLLLLFLFIKKINY